MSDRESVTVAAALREAAARLAATFDTARLDAELLMAHALGVTRSDLLLRHLGDEVPGIFDALIERRLFHEPVAYITGRQEFYGLELEVTPDVLIPRGDSETMIEAARRALADRPPERILDLGTGSGALLLAAMTIWPEAQGLGIDRDIWAVTLARRNAERTGINIRPTEEELDKIREELAGAGIDGSSGGIGFIGRARFNHADWRQRGWARRLERYDLILANPPYVENDAELPRSVRAFEPPGALFSGPEGLDDYRILIPQLPALLAQDGVALVEIGHTQADAVTAIAARARLAATLHRDLAGRPRVLELVHFR